MSDVNTYAHAHDWQITSWEYDDTFFQCRICKLKTHCRRGYPAKTAKECIESGINPCKKEGT